MVCVCVCVCGGGGWGLWGQLNFVHMIGRYAE